MFLFHHLEFFFCLLLFIDEVLLFSDDIGFFLFKDMDFFSVKSYKFTIIHKFRVSVGDFLV